MSAAESSWVASLNLAFVDERFGKDAVNRALKESTSYEVPPALDARGKLTAAQGRRTAMGRTAVGRGDDTARDGDLPPVEVQVRLQGASVELSCSCTRGRPYRCEHVIALVVDVAVSPSLREALLRGESVAATLPALAEARRNALEMRMLPERLEQWLTPKRTEDSLELEIEVVSSSGIPGGDDRPALVLRVRQAGKRALVPPSELAAARLPPELRRKLELAVSSAFFKNAFIATRAQASLLIHLLSKDAGRAHSGRLAFRFERRSVVLRAEPEDHRLVAKWWTREGAPVVPTSAALLFSGPFPFVYSRDDATFWPVDESVDLDVAWGMTLVPSLPLTADVKETIGRTLLRHPRAPKIELPPAVSFGLFALEEPRFELRLSGTPLEITGELHAVYKQFEVEVTPEASRIDDERRNWPLEARGFDKLREAGLVDDEGRIFATEDAAARFWSEGAEKLRESEDPRLTILLAESIARSRLAPPVQVKIAVGITSRWLKADLEFSAKMLKVEIAKLHAAIARNRKWIELEDGSISRISEEIRELVNDARNLRGSDARNPGGIAAYQMAFIEDWVERFGGTYDEDASRLRDTIRAGFKGPAVVPKGLEATLRPYQQEGLAWLQGLRAIGAGGILADDMGLGKTVTTLALLLEWKESHGTGTALVVCPTSVVGNWRDEAARFTKDLRVLVIDGGARKASREEITSFDLVVTTYGILRRDIETFEPIHFRAVILDEAQNVKNTSAEITRAVNRLDGELRLALSGTPIENRLNDLWSIMTFCNPGLLGAASDFEQRFARPIGERPRGEVAARLRRIVQPFILRRTKAAVLVDLPPKTEIGRRCIPSFEEKKLYEALALTVRQAVKQNVERRGLARSRMSVLTAILRLRQMACDPRLIDAQATSFLSAKREAFLDLARDIALTGKRALVFSQFVELFTLWRADLDRERIPYEYLDGQSTDRPAIIDRFQTGSAPLFLISLKAGGVGINLTAADTVILCDPWWNPAVEDQATGRAHRIGQTRPITVVRLIATGTIEEKIDELKEQKRELAGLLESDPEGHRSGDDAEEGARPGSAPGALTEADIATLLEMNALLPADRERPVLPAIVSPVPSLAKTPLTLLEIDQARSQVRGLVDSGVDKRVLAKQIGLSFSRLALLLNGHRVPMTRKMAEALQARHDERWNAPFLETPSPASDDSESS